MAFSTTINRLRKFLIHGATGSNYDTGNVTAGATGTNTVTVTLSALSGAPSFGLIHIRDYGLTTASLGTLDITATDGTTTINLASFPAPSSPVAGQGREIDVFFKTELSLTSITVTSKDTGGNTTMSTDVEVLSSP